MATRTGREGTLTVARATGGVLAAAVSERRRAVCQHIVIRFAGLSRRAPRESHSTITTEHVPKVGTVLATSSGLTLYRYTVDPAGKATCTGACAKAWPPLLLSKGRHPYQGPAWREGADRRQGAGRAFAGVLPRPCALPLRQRHQEGRGQRAGGRGRLVRSPLRREVVRAHVGHDPASTGGAVPARVRAPAPARAPRHRPRRHQAVAAPLRPRRPRRPPPSRCPRQHPRPPLRRATTPTGNRPTDDDAPDAAPPSDARRQLLRRAGSASRPRSTHPASNTSWPNGRSAPRYGHPMFAIDAAMDRRGFLRRAGTATAALGATALVGATAACTSSPHHSQSSGGSTTTTTKGNTTTTVGPAAVERSGRNAHRARWSSRATRRTRTSALLYNEVFSPATGRHRVLRHRGRRPALRGLCPGSRRSAGRPFGRA